MSDTIDDNDDQPLENEVRLQAKGSYHKLAQMVCNAKKNKTVFQNVLSEKNVPFYIV